jgi:hypothetical protein
MVLVILTGNDEKPDKFLDKTLWKDEEKVVEDWRNEENVEDED